MRLLGIHYNFPPVKTVGTLRLLNFYQHLSPFAPHPIILTSAQGRGRDIDPALELNIEYQRIELPTLDLRGLKTVHSGRTYVKPKLRQSPGGKALARLSQSFPFNLLWGDGGMVYIMEGYRRGLTQIQNAGITHLFSSYRPYSDHLIAWLLKRRFPHLVWIADFRDLHVDPSRKNVYCPAFQRWCNRIILAQADCLTTVSEGLARNLRQYNPEVFVLRNGIGSNLQAPKAPPTPPFPKAPVHPFTISYTGSLYPDKQSADPLFTTLAAWRNEGKLTPENFRLVYAGKDAHVWKSWLGKFQLNHLAETHGLVDLGTARQLQTEADMNLLLSWSSPGQTGILTAKVYEYLAAQRPILCLIEGQTDPELIHLVEKSGAGHVSVKSADQQKTIRSYLQALIREWQSTGKSLTRDIDPEVLRTIRWDTMMEGFMKTLQDNYQD